MAQVQDFVKQSLTLVGAGLTAPGFGKPLIVAYDCPAGFTGLYREYSSQGGPAALIADGFLASGPTYQMAAKLCSQSPCPPIFAVGKGGTAPTQIFDIVLPTPGVGTVYEFELDGIQYPLCVGAAAWATGTDYVVGDTVTNVVAASAPVKARSQTYVCTAITGAGASAASGTGPIGFGSGITDNEVTWAFVGFGTSTDTATALAAIPKSTTAGIQPAWVTATYYQVGDVVQSDTGIVKTYICTSIVGLGESGAAPTGTGSNIADFKTAGTNGVYWAYVGPAPTIGSASATLSFTATTAGDFHSLSVTPLQTSTLGATGVSTATGDAGIATDLAAILAVNNTWYGFCLPFQSKAIIVAATAWALTNNKLLVAQTQDSDVINVAPLTGTDVGVTLLNTGSANANGGGVALIYKSTTDDFADAAWLGACLSLIPGSETWAFKSLVGVPAEAASYWLSETQRSNAAGSLSAPGGKQVNLYENVGGANITEKGTVSSSQYLYIDLVRGFAWLQANLSTAVFSGIIAGSKLPFTDAGIAVVEAEIRGVLKQGIANGLLTDNPAPTVTVPKASSVSSTDKANRLLEGVSYSCETAGAIQGVSIQGSVSF